MHALEEFHGKCKRQGITLLLAGVHAQPIFAIMQAKFDEVIGLENMFETIGDALKRAGEIMRGPRA